MKQRDSEEFIMLPTVDFCFKELMKNEKARKGFVAAVIGKDPKKIRRTELLPTELRRESEDDKQGILDVLIELEDSSMMNMEMQVPYFEFWPNRILFYISKVYSGQIREGEGYDQLRKCIHVSILDFIHFPQDKRCYRKVLFCDADTGEVYTDLMELHILELKKLPPEDQNEAGIIRWMRFLSGKSRKEFDHMAEKDEYIREACGELKKLSLDEKKRLEYELRQKAIRDYNTQIHSAEKRGEQRGIQDTLKRLVKANAEAGKTREEIAEFLGIDLLEVQKLIEE